MVNARPRQPLSASLKVGIFCLICGMSYLLALLTWAFNDVMCLLAVFVLLVMGWVTVITSLCQGLRSGLAA